MVPTRSHLLWRRPFLPSLPCPAAGPVISHHPPPLTTRVGHPLLLPSTLTHTTHYTTPRYTHPLYARPPTPTTQLRRPVRPSSATNYLVPAITQHRATHVAPAHPASPRPTLDCCRSLHTAPPLFHSQSAPIGNHNPASAEGTLYRHRPPSSLHLSTPSLPLVTPRRTSTHSRAPALAPRSSFSAF